MTFLLTCDYCGDDIGLICPYATITVDHKNQKAQPKRERWTGGYAGHYHPECWTKVHDVIDLVHDYAPSIEQIPTISGQAVAARRRKHTKQDEED